VTLSTGCQGRHVSRAAYRTSSALRSSTQSLSFIEGWAGNRFAARAGSALAAPPAPSSAPNGQNASTPVRPAGGAHGAFPRTSGWPACARSARTDGPTRAGSPRSPLTGSAHALLPSRPRSWVVLIAVHHAGARPSSHENVHSLDRLRGFAGKQQDGGVLFYWPGGLTADSLFPPDRHAGSSASPWYWRARCSQRLLPPPRQNAHQPLTHGHPVGAPTLRHPEANHLAIKIHRSKVRGVTGNGSMTWAGQAGRW